VTISVVPVAVEEILLLRDIYRQEMNCQIIHDSLHAREGWTLSFLLKIDGAAVGYGAVAVSGPWEGKPTIFEFYVLPQNRGRLFALFAALLAETGATLIETQTNDALLSTILHALSASVECESILFHDKITTTRVLPGAEVRRATDDDAAEIHARELDEGAKWVLVVEGGIAGTGGILFHYNRPYGDIYMAVAEPFRRRGFGSYLVQELKRICYEQGSVPAARCRATNIASRATLQKAGFVPCGNLVTGSVAHPSA
jgi:GNAT superfamily N-acetyltransferase